MYQYYIKQYRQRMNKCDLMKRGNNHCTVYMLFFFKMGRNWREGMNVKIGTSTVHVIFKYG